MNNYQPLSIATSSLKKLLWLISLAALSAPLAVHSDAEDDVEEQFTDLRTYVKMPDKARQILTEDMLDHLAVLNEINRYLSENELTSAAEVAETGMGRSLLSKYQDEEFRPGHYMPKAMREIGWELHNAATEFSQAARQGNMQETLQGYQRITSACVACHYSYRTR